LDRTLKGLKHRYRHFIPLNYKSLDRTLKGLKPDMIGFHLDMDEEFGSYLEGIETAPAGGSTGHRADVWIVP